VLLLLLLLLALHGGLLLGGRSCWRASSCPPAEEDPSRDRTISADAMAQLGALHP
jgi:hypothetical protein